MTSSTHQPASTTSPFIDRLIEAAAQDWHAYTHHDFVEQLADGTLPLERFQDYLVQDYLFLIQFARASALGAYKSRRLQDISRMSDTLASLVGETRLHVQLTQEWGISAEELEQTPEKVGTVAYTRFVLDTGMAGDLLDLQIAKLPCYLGYAQIGTRLADRLEQDPDHPYAAWIAEYAGDTYQQAARDFAEHVEDLAERAATPARRADLERTFATATRMEIDFWAQSL